MSHQSPRTGTNLRRRPLRRTDRTRPTLSTLILALVAWAPGPSNAGTAEPDPPPHRSRLGINLSGIADWGTEHPFCDAFKTARPWISQRNGAPWGQGPALDLDELGWVRRLEPGTWAETLLFTAGHAPKGTYTCLYDGEGTLEIHGGGRITQRAPGRLEFELLPEKGALFLQLRATHPDRPVRNIQVLMPDCHAGSDPGPFRPAFLDRWRGFNTIRFMDWMETNNSEQRTWSDRPRPEDATWSRRGVPVEIMIELCNRLGANPWFCMPHQADDDYVRSFARTVRERLRRDLVVYVEYSNEVWNSLFAQHRYAAGQGRRLGFADTDWEAAWRFNAWRARQIHGIWEEVFGGRSRIVRVIASQAANPYVTEQTLRFRDSARHFDALAIAPYFSLNVAPQRSGHVPPAGEVASWSVEQLLDHVRRHSLPEAVEHMRAQRALAEKHGLRLIAYEAGQHLVGIQGAENNDALTRLLQAANRHPAMGGLYQQYLDAWLEVAGGDLCCLFSSCGAYSKWGSWGLLEGSDQTTSPKYDAVIRWNRSHPMPATAEINAMRNPTAARDTGRQLPPTGR